ncbi:hypothetical protein LIER_35610 [Lithospermum erythrorhizon]|uniref:Uncharacterized protein n=1 Tax=Lithospermum erythrorhizon TaxID=34254 RepID=A0AAV3NUV3_LITER
MQELKSSRRLKRGEMDLRVGERREDNNNEQTTLMVCGNDPDGEKKKKSWCGVCKKSDTLTCWKIHRKPPGWKPKTDRALHTISQISQD